MFFGCVLWSDATFQGLRSIRVSEGKRPFDPKAQTGRKRGQRKFPKEGNAA
jgi:hypothetical protein